MLPGFLSKKCEKISLTKILMCKLYDKKSPKLWMKMAEKTKNITHKNSPNQIKTGEVNWKIISSFEKAITRKMNMCLKKCLNF